MQRSNGIFTLHKKRDGKRGSLMISTLALGLIPAAGKEKFQLSFAGMTLNKCAVLLIGTLTGAPLCSLKNATIVYSREFLYIE